MTITNSFGGSPPATITLPDKIGTDEPIYLLHILPAQPGSAVTLDFGNVDFWVPSAIIALLCKIQRWLTDGIRVQIANAEKCPAFRYLQRIDFFTQCGIKLDENFLRHNSTGRFVPVRRIGGKGSVAVEQVSTEVTECIVPQPPSTTWEDTPPIFDYLEYSISELALNVVQHSSAFGFVAAQFYPKSDLIRVGIGDIGIGIRQSFERYGSPHWSASMSHLDAIQKSFEPKVSCKLHLSSPWGESINAGVGLTLLRSLVRAVNGTFFVASYGSFCGLTSAGHLPDNAAFEGTLCSMSFRRSQVTNFNCIAQVQAECENVC